MIKLFDVRYVRLGTANRELATKFATEIVGLDIARVESTATYLKSDHRDHTLCYFDGDPSDQTVGWELWDPNDLESAAAELEQKGYAVHRGTKEECEQRAVRGFINLKDPTGNSLDIVARPYDSSLRYHGSRDAGITGFNHAALCSTDPERDEKFWTQILNARVSDWIAHVPLMRVSSTHHSLALFPDTKKGIQHINHQVASVDDIMKSYYFLLERNIPIKFGPGRHATSGAMFLYFEGPDGVIFEYSHGVREITPEQEATYRPRQFPFENASLCYWGAKPNMSQFK
ncbi:VOC family protein [Ferribacterium limneticum]|uniref:VOC family protein n=1 Tax=Ferribacterium limneticum TaxID=76259 RepID=UPI001CFBDCB2|nr:VOC family protein [Ferribacterium limneticum]UCV17839.1 VOC family protein [Ferribacterium limneticum]